MKRIKRYCCIICAVLLLLSCVSCTNTSGSTNEDESKTIAMSIEIAIAEEVYLALVNPTCDIAVGEEAASDLEPNPALCDYVRVDNGDDVYYEYKSGKQNYLSINELTKALRALKVLPGVPIFDTMTASGKSNEEINLSLHTTEITEKLFSGATSLDQIPEEWLRVAVTVTLPGDIDVTQNSATVQTQQNGNEVTYTVCDFSEPQTITIYSSLAAFPLIYFAIVGAVICSVIVVLIYSLGRKHHKKSEE